ARHHTIACLQPTWRNNIAPLAVGIYQQRQMRTTIGVVFEPFNPCRHTVLVALEIDQPIMLTMPAPAMTRRNAAVVVAATGLALLCNQTGDRSALVQCLVFHTDDKPATRGGRL